MLFLHDSKRSVFVVFADMLLNNDMLRRNDVFPILL